MWPGRDIASVILFGSAVVALNVSPVAADQGGVSFWLPGSFGSMAAPPVTPGWSLGLMYFHTSASAGGDVAAARSIHLGDRTADLTINLNAHIDGDADLAYFTPTYTWASPILGGQLSTSLSAVFGNSRANIEANVTGALGPIGFAGSHRVSDALTAFGDLSPQATLKWNDGVQSYLLYGMLNLPVGAYDPSRLANLGLGYWAIDGGAGYTYNNPKTGYEFSAVTGFTYNLTNPALDYQNGVDWHLDLGASKLVTKQLYAGLVGYAYQQLTPDSGPDATFGDFKSRVFGAGPQIDYQFPVWGMQGEINLKGYREFGAEHRPEGWNLWLAFAMSPQS